MPGPKPPAITLSAEERGGLEKLVNRASTPQQQAVRARIILQAAAGHNNAEIAEQLSIGIDMVRLWRRRWVSLHAIALTDLSLSERLTDAARPGRPAEITAEQVCQLIELACEAPAKSGRPITQWTGREIADELIARGIVERISPRHAARLLKKTISART